MTPRWTPDGAREHELRSRMRRQGIERRGTTCTARWRRRRFRSDRKGFSGFRGRMAGGGVVLMITVGCPPAPGPEAIGTTAIGTTGSGTTNFGTTGPGITGSGTTDSGAALPDVPVLDLSFSQVKRFDFSWAAAAGAEYYQLLESVAPMEPFERIGEDIEGDSISFTMPLHRATSCARAMPRVARSRHR